MTSDAGTPGTPRFNVVLRGYDRRQVDEHVARLQRVIARMRADLTARSQYGDGPGYSPVQRQRQQQPQRWSGPPPGPGMAGPPGESPDTIGGFTDRMQRILQSAEEEAEEIRNKARAAARAESEQVRAQLDELLRQREGMLRELAMIRGQLPEPASDRTTRLARPHPGDPPHGAVPSPRPRPAMPTPPPPPASTPSSSSMGSSSTGSSSTGGRSESPRRNSRFDWPSTPPLWEISTQGPPNGPGAGRPGGPAADSRSPAGPNLAAPNPSAPNPSAPNPSAPNPSAPNPAPPKASPPNVDPLQRDHAAASERGGPAVPAVEPPSATAVTPGPERRDPHVAEKPGLAESAPSAAARLASSRRPFNGTRPETGVLFKVPPAPTGQPAAATDPSDEDEVGGTVPVEVEPSDVAPVHSEPVNGKDDGAEVPDVQNAEVEPADGPSTADPPADARPADAQPADARSAEAQPAEAQPAEVGPPGDGKVVYARAADGSPADAGIADTQPVGDERTVVVRAAQRSGPGAVEGPQTPHPGAPDDDAGASPVRTNPSTTTSRSG